MASIIAPELQEFIKTSRFLIVGAGGIGCELVKNLVLLGFRKLTILDLDTIDVSNLNRQFLFRRHHVGKSKAESAAQALNDMISLETRKEMELTTLMDDITVTKKFDTEFFKSFRIVINALDNEVARKVVNRQCLIAKVPLIEAGSTGYAGQVFPIYGGITECYDCTPQPPVKGFAVCTIRATPERPQHTIAWAQSLLTLLFGPQSGKEDNLLADLGHKARELRLNSGEDEPFNFAVGLANFLFNDEIITIASHTEAWLNRPPPTPIATDQQDFETQCHALKLTDDRHHGNELDATKRIIVTEPNHHLKMFLYAVELMEKSRIKDNREWTFDKDDVVAMTFVAYAANLRNINYHIEVKSYWDAQSIAGSIIPTIASTNAIVAGIQSGQLIQMLKKAFYDQTHPTEPTKHHIGHCDLNINKGGSRSMKLIASNPLDAPSSNCLFCRDAPMTHIGVYKYSDWNIEQFVKKILIGELGLRDPAFSAPGADGLEYDPDNLDVEDYTSYILPLPLDANIGMRLEVTDVTMSSELIIKIHEDSSLGGSEEAMKRHPKGYSVASVDSDKETKVEEEVSMREGSVEYEGGDTKMSSSDIEMDELLVDGGRMREEAGKRPSDESLTNSSVKRTKL